MHGFAFNVATDLRFFDYIVPCGIADRGVTSLARELGQPVEEADVRRRLLTHFAEAFGAELTVLDREMAQEFLAAYLGEAEPLALMQAS
jgi:lipoyl(octanoyl) transferase